MSGLLMVVLVCATSLPTADCSRNTALDVIVTPANSPMECLVHGQVTAASAGLPGQDKRYLKIGCERRAQPDASAGRAAR